MRFVLLTVCVSQCNRTDYDFIELIVKQLQDSLAVLSPELLPIHQRLVSIRRTLVSMAAKGPSHKSDLKPIQEELRKIDGLSR